MADLIVNSQDNDLTQFSSGDEITGKYDQLYLVNAKTIVEPLCGSTVMSYYINLMNPVK